MLLSSGNLLNIDYQDSCLSYYNSLVFQQVCYISEMLPTWSWMLLKPSMSLRRASMASAYKKKGYYSRVNEIANLQQHARAEMG